MTTPARVFGIDYQFLSCGDVFTVGLRHAAESLDVAYAHASWDALDLPEQIAAFRPDLVLVVHGRKFVDRWRYHRAFHTWPTAVWLLDEPYEVDETVRIGQSCQRVFVNDAATLHRHHHATVLPVCYDPLVHTTGPAWTARRHTVGFIGGGNETRERILVALAQDGHVSYLIGGPFSHHALVGAVVSRNVPAAATAGWYQQTRIVVNVFRDRHHFNQQGIPGTALNPRVYEAAACGALVVSEWRPEIETVCPELPTFRTAEEAVAVVRALLADPARAVAVQAACAARLAPHTYAARLRSVLAACQLEAAA